MLVSYHILSHRESIDSGGAAPSPKTRFVPFMAPVLKFDGGRPVLCRLVSKGSLRQSAKSDHRPLASRLVLRVSARLGPNLSPPSGSHRRALRQREVEQPGDRAWGNDRKPSAEPKATPRSAQPKAADSPWRLVSVVLTTTRVRIYCFKRTVGRHPSPSTGGGPGTIAELQRERERLVGGAS